MTRRIFALVLTLTATAALAQKAITPSRWNLFSREQDVQLGREAASQIERQVAVVENRTVNDFVQNMGRRLAAQPEAGGYPYTFKVVYDKSINAFALPGGPTYVHTGLINAADNEAQVAGVLAHEIAHVALRHGTTQVTKANAANLILGLGGAILGGGGSMLGQLAQLGAGLGANSLLLKFSRDAESDADIVGARIMAKAGYDPVEMARFFEKLEAQERRSGGSVPQFLSDHPSPGNRVKAVSAEVRSMPSRQYSKGDGAELSRVQNTIQSLPVPPKANTDFRNSGDPTNSRPSSRLKQFRGRGVALNYPENWQVFQSQGASEVTIAPRDGIVASNGQADVAYGSIIGIVPLRQRNGVEADTRAWLNDMLQRNRSLRVGDSRRVQVAGGPGMLNILYGTSAYRGQREVIAAVTGDHPEGLFYMLLIAPESEYQRAQPVFESMIQSVQFSR